VSGGEPGQVLPDARYIGAARLGRQRRAGELGGVAGQERGEIAGEPGWAGTGEAAS
jgi:hypothetical protein